MVFKSANCPNCGGELQIPDDRDTVNCMYCNTKIVVREVLAVSVKSNLENIFRLADTALEAGNNDEAYAYYTQILEEDGANSRAWFGKGVAAGWQSSLLAFKLPEMVASFQNAIKYADDEAKDRYRIMAADSITSVSTALYSLSRQHLVEFASIAASWPEYLDRCSMIISSYGIAHKYSPTDRIIIENIIHVCQNNIEGVSYYDDVSMRTKARSLSPGYESKLKNKMDKYVSLLQTIDPSYQPPKINKKKSSLCYVATATMGCENHPRVVILRQFRDRILLPTRIGKQLVSYYYQISPKIANIIQNRWFLRKLSYVIIVFPASEIAGKILPNKATSRAPNVDSTDLPEIR